MKKFTYKTFASQQGFLAIVAVIFIVIIGFLGTAVAYMVFGESTSAVKHFQSANAFYLAGAGLEHATHKLLEPITANRSGCNAISTTAITNTLGSGAYSVSSTGAPFFAGTQVTATALTSAITAAVTTIPVDSTAGYPTSGKIMLDGEYISYASVTATSFTNAVRGVDGTVAAPHANNTPVGSFQCALTSIGAVPNLASSSARRVLQQSVALDYGWMVGDTSGGRFNAESYNNPADNSWNDYNQSGAINLNSVYMNSYADAWFVGASGFAAHWLGTFNTIASITFNPAVTYRSVWCNAFNQCFAVGDASGGAVIQNWNGATWSRATLPGGSNTNLFSVMCTSNPSITCWAVGDAAGRDYFYVWSAGIWTRVAVTLNRFPYRGVFCNSATDCWAVGLSGFARKSGATWTNFTTGIVAAQYNGITCNNTSDCWAVGQINSARDLIMHWNGSAWSRDASNPTPVGNLNAVSCVDANNCWAVGATTANVPVIIHYDGTGWTQFTNITNGPLPAAPLRGVFILGPSTKPYSNWSEAFA